MMTGVPLAVTSANIALFSKSNENSLADSLVRLASGKRVNRPSDGISDFFFSEKLKRNSRDSEYILRNIEDTQAFTSVAADAGESVYNVISDMRALVKQYYLPDTDENDRMAIAAEFNSLRDTVTGLKQSSRYDGMMVISDNGGSPFKQVVLDQYDPSVTLSVSYDDTEDIADVTALNLGVTDEATELAAVEQELGRAGSYLAKTSAYERGLNAHYSIVQNRILTESENADRAVEASTGEEYVAAMNKSIRSEAAYAMLAQANMYRTSIVRLFG